MYFEKNQQTIKSVNIFSVGKGFNKVWLILQEKLNVVKLEHVVDSGYACVVLTGNIFYLTIDVLRPLSNDLWNILFQKVDT